MLVYAIIYCVNNWWGYNELEPDAYVGVICCNSQVWIDDDVMLRHSYVCCFVQYRHDLEIKLYEVVGEC